MRLIARQREATADSEALIQELRREQVPHGRSVHGSGRDKDRQAKGVDQPDKREEGAEV